MKPTPITFGRVTELLLENFKAFAQLQRIPIRPITLIYGRNNSGKSSIIQSLLYAEHVRRTRDFDPRSIVKGGATVLRGGMSRIRHGLSHKPVRFGWAWKNPESTLGFCEGECLQELGNLPLEASLNGRPFLTLDDDESWLFPTPDLNHPDLGAAIDNTQSLLATDLRIWLSESGGRGFAKELQQLISVLEKGEFNPIAQYLFSNTHGLRIRQLNIPPEFENLSVESEIWDGWGGPSVPGVRATALLSKDVALVDAYLRQHPTRPEEKFSEGVQDTRRAFLRDFVAQRGAFILFRWFEDVWAHISGALDGLVGSTHYLSAVRKRPEHVFMNEPMAFNEDTGKRSPRGWVRQESDWILQADTLDAANRWLAEKKDLTGNIRIHYKEAPKSMRDELTGATPVSLSVYDRTRHIRLAFDEVGFGISQFLPVLLASFAQQNEVVRLGGAAGTLLLEEPEAHVHPALQSEIAELLIGAVSRQERPLAYVVAETHSEHLLLRLMRRIREGRLSPSMVSVLYVENLGEQSVVREMPLSGTGELIYDWPGGFFEEGLREMLQ